MNRPTASKLDLLEVCPGAASLQWTRDTSEAGTNGTNRHAFVERSAKGDRSGAVELLPEAIRERMEKVDLDRLFALFPTHPRSEVPMAYDPIKDTARELPQGNGHRDYSDVKPGEIHGTIDLLSVGDECVVVADLKTGQGYVTHARDSRQVQFAAVASAKIHGKRAAVGAILKVEEDGAIRLLSASWDDMDLDGFAHELGEIYRAVHAPNPRLVTGQNCRWCPARTHCPEIVAASQALVPLSLRSDALTPEVAAMAWSLMKGVEGAVETMKERLRPFIIERGGIPLPNGKFVRPSESERESLILAAAIDAADGDTNVVGKILAAGTLSKDSLRKHMPPADAEKLIDSMRKANGIRTNHTTTLREVNHPRGGK